MEVKIYEVSKGLVKRGHQVALLTIQRDPKTRKHELIQGVDVYRFKLTGLFVLPKFLHLMITRKVNLVHVHFMWRTGLLCALVGRILGRPAVLGLAGSDVYHPLIRPKFLSPFYLKVVKTIINLLITTSEDLKKKALKNGFPPRIIPIPQGVDLERFDFKIEKEKTREQLGVADEPLVLSVAQLIPRKGLIYLIRAVPEVLKSVPNAKFVIAGEGPERPKLEEEIKQLGVENAVKLLGGTSYDMVPKLYAAADVFVLPTLYDAMPHAIYEAMAMAKPVIATRVGGIPEVIENGSDGLLVEAMKPDEIAKAAVTLLKNRELTIRLGKNALKKIKEMYTWEKIVQRYEQAYREVMKIG
ncbi:MAG: glycosyltransferase family 4 protein [Candidatus Bathyarchaeia archaeon]